MKRIFALASLVFVLPSIAVIVVAAPSPLDAERAVVSRVESPPAIVERGPHHSVWQKTVTETLANGRVVSRRSGYTEFSVGMNYLKDGQWISSRAEVELFQDGAVARQGQIQVIFAPSIATPRAIDLLTPDGKRLSMNVLGLAVFDRATQRSELVAEIQPAIGELHPPNVVVYPDAFTDVRAALRFTYSRDRFEQDVILLERFTLPPGFNEATTMVEIWNEALEDVELVKTVRQINGFTDETLDLRVTYIPHGRALTLEDPQGRTWSAPIFKQWIKTGGRQFLVESVPYLSIKLQLGALPAPPQGAAVRPRAAAQQMAALQPGQRPFPPKLAAPKVKGKIQMAAAGAASVAALKGGQGLIADYSVVTTATNMVFRNDTTYFVYGSSTLKGAIFEGGTVLKIDTSDSNLTFTDSIVCRTKPYSPAFVTRWSDDTVGEIISPAVAGPRTNFGGGIAIKMDNGVVADLKHMRFSHLNTAFSCDYDTPGPHSLSHIQLVNCRVGFQPVNASLKLRNVLMAGVFTNFSTTTYSSTAHGEHLTICRSDKLASTNSGGTLALNFTNSLLVAVTNSAPYAGANNAAVSDPASVFQTVGASAHYLLDNTYRNIGTTNIDANLLADLKQRTTYPPVVLSNTIIGLDTTLYPIAQRDSDAPDLGYHAVPLDYVLNYVWLTNATLTVSAGTALGYFAPNYGGYGLQPLGGQIICQGTPTALNRFVRYNTVQEQANTNWIGDGVGVMTASFGNPGASTARFRFTEFSTPAGGYYLLSDYGAQAATFALTDCQIWGGGIYNYRIALSLTNTLLHRAGLLAEDFDFAYDMDFHNCLVRGGVLSLYKENTGIWSFTDNLFDATTIYTNTLYTNSHNAYTTNIARLAPYPNNDVVLTVTNFTYEDGPLGWFYQPSNSALINAGSTWATNVGLAHFTVTTNQVKETGVVDISFHYPALTGTNSTATATDGEFDSYFDYAEDLNGNGSFDAGSGETDWTAYNSRFGIGSGPGLVVFTPLK